MQERDCRTTETNQNRTNNQPPGRPAPFVCAIDCIPGTTNALRASSRATSAEVAVLVPAALAADGSDGGGGDGGGGGGGGDGGGGGGWSGTRGSRDSHGADAWFDSDQRPGR